MKDESRRLLAELIRKLRDKGTEGVIQGCTELGLLAKASDCPTPLFDTTILHAEAAAELAMG